MEPIALEDLALLEVLVRIDQRADLVEGDTEVVKRLVESGLAEKGDGELTLTVAGVEMCKSLQHRAAADAQAERIRRERSAGLDDAAA
ncbi:hypothetical protein QFW77_14435 [Luteimonas sp. RD2P54]|uniref:Preprotein translocase subunit SecA n=1 Tax=Luteimonas endophytica TaxID=3042023 RepID=A0ABT6JBG6_9GAMM|nr:hypothetical protein [Luteimonas endophytica]MDH5824175.1 hypothetical protein [Luteimonas endophytica]